MYYYKQIGEAGEVVSVLACETNLAETETQVAITEQEYLEIVEAIPDPEPLPERNGYTLTQEEIDAAYQEGVQEA